MSELNTPIWQTAMWVTMGFIFLFGIMQDMDMRASKKEARYTKKMIVQNEKLFSDITELQTLLFNLNRDLGRLSRENKYLRQEIETLTNKVHVLEDKVNGSARPITKNMNIGSVSSDGFGTFPFLTYGSVIEPGHT